MTETTESTETETETPAAYVGEGLTDAQVIAMRTADESGDEADHFTKVFVYPPGPKPIEANGIDHAANLAAAREFAIQSGMRPTGDASVKSVKRHRDGIAWDVTVIVPVILTERAEGASEGDLVLGGEDAPANSDGAGSSEDTRGQAPTEPTKPTEQSTRAQIDEYGAERGIDTTGAATKADALALLP